MSKTIIWIRTGLVIAFFLIIIFYAYEKTKNIAGGPQIKVEGISNGETLTNPLVEIKGTVMNVSLLTINGDQTFMDESGRFNKTILLLPGYNLVSVEASDKSGKKVGKEFELVYNLPSETNQ